MRPTRPLPPLWPLILKYFRKSPPELKVLFGPNNPDGSTLDQFDQVQITSSKEVVDVHKFVSRKDYGKYGSPVERLEKVLETCKNQDASDCTFVHSEVQADVDDAQKDWDPKK